jgi:aryl-alcohol dehydrogenase-like predicted oxidoreductase
VALGGLLAQDSYMVPIPGTMRSARVDEKVAAARVSLSADEAAKLSAALPPGAAAGGRYPDGGMKAVYI